MTPPRLEDDNIAAAERSIAQIGGFNGNGVEDIAPLASAFALVGIGYELRRIADALEALQAVGTVGSGFTIRNAAS